jgi:hypothetical protein
MLGVDEKGFPMTDYLETYPALPCLSSSDSACAMPWESHCPVALQFVSHSLGACARLSPECWFCTKGWEPNVQRSGGTRSSCYRPTDGISEPES